MIYNLMGLAAAAMLLMPGLVSCDNQQDNINELGERIEALERSADQLNTEVNALYAVYQALHSKANWITGVVEEAGGWRISFNNQPDVVIAHGKDGQDGHVPQISIAEDDLGRLCWKVDGAFVTVDGVPVFAEAVDGKPALIPSFRINIETREWEINYKAPYENEADWKSTGVVADGKPGKPGGDPNTYIFKSVAVDKALGQVTFTLRDGKTFVLPLKDVK